MMEFYPFIFSSFKILSGSLRVSLVEWFMSMLFSWLKNMTRLYILLYSLLMLIFSF